MSKLLLILRLPSAWAASEAEAFKVHGPRYFFLLRNSKVNAEAGSIES
jgi:hypothetical protein